VQQSNQRKCLVDLKNQIVRIKIRDVYLPDPLIILNLLHGEDFLSGKVIDISQSSSQASAFAVIEVKELDQMIIVPVEKLYAAP
jgi:hypothetical protein